MNNKYTFFWRESNVRDQIMKTLVISFVLILLLFSCASKRYIPSLGPMKMDDGKISV